MDASSTKPSETLWHNGHGFVLNPDLSRLCKQAVATCKKCGHRSDNPEGRLRPCIGHPVEIPPSGHGLTLEFTYQPKGRKPMVERVWLDIDALGELLDLARKVPHEDRGHAYWHWRNPDRDYPCETCPSPLGDQARAFAKAKLNAIDVDLAPAKLRAGIITEGRAALAKDMKPGDVADTDGILRPVPEDEDDPKGTAATMTADRLTLDTGHRYGKTLLGKAKQILLEAVEDNGFILELNHYTEENLVSEIRRILTQRQLPCDYDDLPAQDQADLLDLAKTRLDSEYGWTCEED